MRYRIGGAVVRNTRDSELRLYVANPTSNTTGKWYVWDQYHAERPPVFFGKMEDCGLVADALNRQRGPHYVK